jgi:DNA-binding transcriptional MerR regulator
MPNQLEPLTIGQLAKQFGVSTRSLRYYEEHGLITPLGRTEGKYRLYDGTTAPKRVKAILALQSLGYSLHDIATMLTATPTSNGKTDTITATRARLSHQQEQLNDKLVLLSDIKQQVDTKLNILENACTPCVANQPTGNCSPDCEHHHVHED